MKDPNEKPIHLEFLWGEGSPETRARVEAFWRSPEGQRRLREMGSFQKSAPELVRPSAATKDVKETDSGEE